MRPVGSPAFKIGTTSKTICTIDTIGAEWPEPTLHLRENQTSIWVVVLVAVEAVGVVA